MFWLAIYPLIVAPVCALFAGVFTWVMTRGQQAQPADLMRHFIFAMAALSLLSYGVTTTDAFRNRFDPSVRAQKALRTVPSYVAVRRYMPYEWEDVEKLAVQAVAADVPTAEVLSGLRARQMVLARRLIAFGRSGAVLAYGEAVLSAMRDVQASNAQLCVRLAWPKAGGPGVDLTGRTSAETAAAYDAAVAKLIAENSLVQKNLSPEQRDPPVTLEAMRAGYASVREAMSARYEAAFVGQLNGPGVASLEPGLACAGSIELLARTLMLPPDVSASVMRNLIRD